MHIPTRSALAIAALLLAAPAGAADLLTLDDGRTLEGEYVGGSRTMLHFRTGSRIDHYPLTAVRNLVFDPAREPLAAVAVPPEPVTNARIVPAGDGLSALQIQRLPEPGAQRVVD